MLAYCGSSAAGYGEDDGGLGMLSRYPAPSCPSRQANPWRGRAAGLPSRDETIQGSKRQKGSICMKHIRPVLYFMLGLLLVLLGLLMGPRLSAHASSGTWSSAGSMSTAREYHTATLLPNGKVLVAGGFYSCCCDLSSAELYDPSTNSW